MSLLLSTKRRIVQFASLGALTSNLWSISGPAVCLPVLHCQACPWSWFICPIGMVSESIAFHEFPVLALAIVLGAGILLGRFFCGWVCPSGFVQDLLFRIPVPKFALPRVLTYLKYVFLFGTVVLVAYFFGKERLFFFCSFCPTATVEVVVPQMIVDHDYALSAWRVLRFGVLGLVLWLAMANRRSFCKIMCPVGALEGLTSRFSLFSLKLAPSQCVHCHKCDHACPMDVPVEQTAESGKKISRDAECIECLDCEAECPTTAIRNNSRVLHK